MGLYRPPHFLVFLCQYGLIGRFASHPQHPHWAMISRKYPAGQLFSKCMRSQSVKGPKNMKNIQCRADCTFSPSIQKHFRPFCRQTSHMYLCFGPFTTYEQAQQKSDYFKRLIAWLQLGFKGGTSLLPLLISQMKRWLSQP